MKHVSILVSLCACMLLLLPSGTWALSSTAEKKNIKKEDSEEMVVKMMAQANEFKVLAPMISVEDALALAKLLETVVEDDQTRILVENMKTPEFEQDPAFQEFLGGASREQLVEGLNQILDELRALEYLFKDPARAVEEMHKDGMIGDAERLTIYRNNPAQLEEDMRSGLYFSFVSFAVAGKFL